MSSFLLRLGARAIGHAAIVPRAAALFETPAAAAIAGPTAPEAVRGAPAVDGAVSRRAPDRRVEAEVPSGEATAARGARGSEPATPLTAVVRLIDPEPRGPGPHADAPRAVEPGKESVASHAVRSADPVRPAVSATLVGMTKIAAATPALVPAHPLPTPRRTESARPTIAASAPASESVEPVRVTIGRVEVRAVLDQAPARAAARAASPSPSLDEYLRKRGRS